MANKWWTVQAGQDKPRSRDYYLSQIGAAPTPKPTATPTATPKVGSREYYLSLMGGGTPATPAPTAKQPKAGVTSTVAPWVVQGQQQDWGTQGTLPAPGQPSIGEQMLPEFQPTWLSEKAKSTLGKKTGLFTSQAAFLQEAWENAVRAMGKAETAETFQEGFFKTGSPEERATYLAKMREQYAPGTEKDFWEKLLDPDVAAGWLYKGVNWLAERLGAEEAPLKLSAKAESDKYRTEKEAERRAKIGLLERSLSYPLKATGVSETAQVLMSALQETANWPERMLGLALIETTPGIRDEQGNLKLSPDAEYQLARIGNTYWSRFSQEQAKALASKVLPEGRAQEALRFMDTLGGLYAPPEEIEEAVQRVLNGEDPEKVAREDFRLAPELVGWVVFDLLNTLDVASLAGKMRPVREIGRATDLYSAERAAELASKGGRLSAFEKRAQEALKFEDAIDQAVAQLARGTKEKDAIAAALAATTPHKPGWQRLMEYVPEARARQNTHIMYSAYSQPLSLTRSVDDALRIVDDWISVNPRSLVGRVAKSPAGELTRRVFKRLRKDIGELPSVKAQKVSPQMALEGMAEAGPPPWNSKVFVLELTDLIDRHLDELYGVEKAKGTYEKFYRGFKRYMSTLYLGMFSPSYLVRQLTTEWATMIFDGVNPFQTQKWIEEWFQSRGFTPLREATKMLTETSAEGIPVISGQRGAQEPLRRLGKWIYKQAGVPEEARGLVRSNLPEKGGLAKAERFAFSVTRYGHPTVLGVGLPVGEQPRWAVSFISWYNRFKRWNIDPMLRKLATDFLPTQGIDPAEIAAILVRSDNPAQIEEEVAKLFRQPRTPLERAKTNIFEGLTPQEMDAIDGELVSMVDDVLRKLPADAGPEEAARAIRDVKKAARKRAEERILETEQEALRKFAEDTEAKELTDDILDEMGKAADELGPDGARMKEEVGQQLRDLDNKIAEARTRAGIAIGEKGGDSWEIGWAALRDAQQIRYQTRMEGSERLVRFVREYRQARGTPAARQIALDYFADRAAGALKGQQLRAARWEEATRQMDQLAQGRGIDDILQNTSRQRAQQRLEDVMNLIDEEMPQGYAPGSVLEEGQDLDFEKMVTARRGMVDRATSGASRQLSQLQQRDVGRAMDIIASADHHQDFLERQTVAAIRKKCRETWAETVAMRQAGRNKQDIALIWEEYFTYRNHAWNVLNQRTVARWNLAEAELRMLSDPRLSHLIFSPSEFWSKKQQKELLNAMRRAEAAVVADARATIAASNDEFVASVRAALTNLTPAQLDEAEAILRAHMAVIEDYLRRYGRTMSYAEWRKVGVGPRGTGAGLAQITNTERRAIIESIPLRRPIRMSVGPRHAIPTDYGPELAREGLAAYAPPGRRGLPEGAFVVETPRSTGVDTASLAHERMHAFFEQVTDPAIKEELLDIVSTRNPTPEQEKLLAQVREWYPDFDPTDEDYLDTAASELYVAVIDLQIGRSTNKPIVDALEAAAPGLPRDIIKDAKEGGVQLGRLRGVVPSFTELQGEAQAARWESYADIYGGGLTAAEDWERPSRTWPALWQQQQRASWYYLRAEQAVQNATWKKMNRDAVIAWMGKQGIKKPELEWSGVMDWLKRRKGDVTRDELLDYLRESQVTVEEVVLQHKPPPVRNLTVTFDEDGPGRWAVLVGGRRSDVMVFREPGGAHVVSWSGSFPDNRPRFATQEEAFEAASNRALSYVPVARPDTSMEPHYEALYTLPGGQEYRELLVTMPRQPGPPPYATLTARPATPDERRMFLGDYVAFGDDGVAYGAGNTPKAAISDANKGVRKPTRPFTGGHYGSTADNVLVHIRFNERTGPNGERVLFIEEIQSDWAARGAEHGFQAPEEYPRWLEERAREAAAHYGVDVTGNEVTSILNDAQESARVWGNRAPVLRAEYRRLRAPGGVPPMPFPSQAEYASLAYKRMLAWASENGFDRIAWTTGDIQVARYPAEVTWKPLGPIGFGRVSGHRFVPEATPHWEISVNGRAIGTVLSLEDARNLPGEAGSKWADKIWASIQAQPEGGSIQPLRSGMESFYDRMMQDLANKYGKPYGATVERIEVPGQRWGPYAVTTASNEEYGDYATLAEAQEVIASGAAGPGASLGYFPQKTTTTQVWSIALPEAQRAAIREQGLPLFQKAAGEAMGRFGMEGEAAILSFFKSHDISTAVHEPAHLFMDDMLRLAEETADPQILEDVRAFERTHGLNEGEARTLNRKMWARTATPEEEARWRKAFEPIGEEFTSYMASGRAPTPELQSLFDRFKEWLVELYRRLTKSNVEVSDEMRGVFDRWLATPEQLEAARVAGPPPPAAAEAVVEAPKVAIADRTAQVASAPKGKAAQAWANPSKAPHQYTYAVVDADSHITISSDVEFRDNPSFPQELQPRARGERKASAELTRKRARELNPVELVNPTPSVFGGPPTVGPDGIVESGNGRLLAIQLAKRDSPERYAAYQEYLRAHAADFGLTPEDIDKVGGTPVLVRVRTDDVPDRVAWVQEANKPATEVMSASETAMADAQRIDQAVLSGIDVGDEQTIDQWLRSPKARGFVRSFMKSLSDAEVNAMVDAGSVLSRQGAERIKAALLGATFPGSAGERLVRVMTESADPAVRNAENAIFQALPQLARAEAAIRQGARPANLSIADDLAAAITKLEEIRQAGSNLEKYAAEARMVGYELPPFQHELMVFLGTDASRSPKTLRLTLREYARMVMDEVVVGQTLMGMPAPTYSKGRFLDRALATATETPVASRFAGAEKAGGGRAYLAQKKTQGPMLPGMEPETPKRAEPQPRAEYAPPWKAEQLPLIPEEGGRTMADLAFQKKAKAGDKVRTPQGDGVLHAVGEKKSTVGIVEAGKPVRIVEMPNSDLRLISEGAETPKGTGATQYDLFGGESPVEPQGPQMGLFQKPGMTDDDWLGLLAQLHSVEKKGFVPGGNLRYADMLEATVRAQEAVLDHIVENLRGKWGTGAAQRLQEQQRRNVMGWLRSEVLPRYYEGAAAAQQFAGSEASKIMLDYGNIRGADAALLNVVPYHYWYTRAGWNWAKRWATRPGTLSHYVRYKQAMKLANENANRRARFEGSVKIPFPWLPDWMGNYLYYDPTQAIFPFASLWGLDSFDIDEETKGFNRVLANLNKYGMRVYPFLDLPYKVGGLRAMAEALQSQGLAPAGDWTETLAPPEGPAGFGYVLPTSRDVQAVTVLLRQVLPGLEDNIRPGGAIGPVETALRGIANVPVEEAWDPYRIARMARNMMMDDAGNWELSRKGLMAMALLDANREYKSLVWQPGSEAAEAVRAKYNWTPGQLAEAQEFLVEAMDRAALEFAFRTVGRRLGIGSLSIEPTGERTEMEIGEQARAQAWTEGTPGGSYEQYNAYRLAHPGLLGQSAAAAFYPGTQLYEGMTPGGRANWMQAKMERQNVNDSFKAELDRYLPSQLWNVAIISQVRDERKKALDALEEQYPMPDETGEITEPWWGMSPEEQADFLAEQIAQPYLDQMPKKEDYWDYEQGMWNYDGWTDYRGQYHKGYNQAMEEWKKQVDSLAVPPELRRVTTTGKYKGYSLADVTEAILQKSTSPLEAAAWAYQQKYVQPAWDEYFRLTDVAINPKTNKHYSGKDAKKMALGKVPAMKASDLIPDILAEYKSNGWTRQELLRVLSNIDIPSMLEWYDVKQNEEGAAPQPTQSAKATWAPPTM